jgi:ATP-dependent helicase/nuclease subunit B
VLITLSSRDERTVGLLRDRLGFEVINLDLDRRYYEQGPSTGLLRLQHRLFREAALAPDEEDDGTVEVFYAPGEGREAVEIARRILANARDGISFDRMAVLLRAPQSYRSHLEEAFARAGIPAHFARGAVRPDPAGKAFVALLKCAAEGLSARRFAEYLSLGQVPDAVAGGAPPEPAPAGDRWNPPDPELFPQLGG